MGGGASACIDFSRLATHRGAVVTSPTPLQSLLICSAGGNAERWQMQAAAQVAAAESTPFFGQPQTMPEAHHMMMMGPGGPMMAPYAGYVLAHAASAPSTSLSTHVQWRLACGGLLHGWPASSFLLPQSLRPSRLVLVALACAARTHALRRHLNWAPTAPHRL
jgi:hypothetical protein